MSTTGIERPIELGPAKVRALLGQRRGELLLPMSPQPLLGARERRLLAGALVELGFFFEPGDTTVHLLNRAFREGLMPDLRCPWGRGGDGLWVREPWGEVLGRAVFLDSEITAVRDGLRWRPAPTMPRAAARLVLKIEDVGIDTDAQGRIVWRLGVEVWR